MGAVPMTEIVLCYCDAGGGFDGLHNLALRFWPPISEKQVTFGRLV